MSEIDQEDLNAILAQIDQEQVPEPPKPEQTPVAHIVQGSEEAAQDEQSSKPKSVVKMYVDPTQLKIDLAFKESDLDMNMAQQAGFYTHYAVASAQAQRQADTAKHQLEITEAGCAHRLREELPLQGVKITEGIIKERVTLDPQVQLAQRTYNEAKTVAEIAKQALEAWRQKRDMMVQFSKHKLEEQKGNPVTREAPTHTEKLAEAGYKQG